MKMMKIKKRGTSKMKYEPPPCDRCHHVRVMHATVSRYSAKVGCQFKGCLCTRVF